ncbi:hypothetical protein Tco_0973066 [Tanacetum coccineum]
METQKPPLKDEDGEEVDVHMYRSMIGSLMYLTSSKPDIMFAVYLLNPKCVLKGFKDEIYDRLEYSRFDGKVFYKLSAAGNIVSAASAATTVSAATTTTATIKTVDDITLAQALEEMKSTKPKKKGEKGKGILIEPMKPMNKKDQIRLDEETALNLQAEFDKEERLAREKAEKEEANIALIETWNDIQGKIDVDHQLAESMQAQEQEELMKKSSNCCYTLVAVSLHVFVVYMLVEKKYPLTPPTLSMMLEKKLIIDYESEMAYQLLKFIMKQLKK